MNKLSFSGHDTFTCRQFWLKKGLDHVWAERKFDDDAVIELGVGRNMVNSIKYWVNAFGLINDENPTILAEKLFNSKDGFDPYLEDINTLWLLHYNLVTTEVASIYSMVFNEFRRLKIEFTREMLNDFILKSCERLGEKNTNSRTVEKDIGVFILNYALPETSKGIESDFSGLLYELNLLTRLERSGKEKWYKIENTSRKTLGARIALFCILYNANGDTTFSFKDLLDKENSIGRVFALSANGLYDKIQEFVQAYQEHLTFTDNAGVKVLQITKELDCWTVLKDYYEA